MWVRAFLTLRELYILLKRPIPSLPRDPFCSTAWPTETVWSDLDWPPNIDQRKKSHPMGSSGEL